MKIFISFFCLSICFYLPLYTQNYFTATGGVDTAWVKHFSTGTSPVACFASKVVTDPSGNIYVAGSAGLIKYDPAGTMIWMSKNDLLDIPLTNVSAMTIDVNGNIYLTGYSHSYSSVTIVTIKYLPSGDTAWVKIYKGSEVSLFCYCTPSSLAVDNDGNVYITGNEDNIYDTNGNVKYYYVTIKYTSSGDMEWVKKHDGGSYGPSSSVIVDAKGEIYVTGYTGTIKYAGDGTQLWSNSFGGTVIGSMNEDNIYVTGYAGTAKFASDGTQQWVDTLVGGQSLRFDNHSNIYVCGTSRYGIDINHITKIDSGGKLLWSKSTGLNLYGGSLDLDQQGNVYITGTRANELPRRQSVVIKFGSLGDSIWAQEFTNDQVGFTRALSIGVDLGGNIVVCGIHTLIDPDATVASDHYQNGKYLSIKYNSDGLRLWEREYNPTRNYSSAHSFSVDPQGSVYITGCDGYFYDTYGKSHQRLLGSFWTLKLNDAGSPQWRQKYSTANGIHDEASLLALDPAGNIIIAGNSYEYNNLYNPALTTIKYTPFGDTIWISKIKGPGETPIWPRALTVDGKGNIYLVGRGSVGYTTVKFNSSGDTTWTRVYGDPGDYYNQPSSIATDTAGNIYVTGSSTVKNSSSETSTDYATIKYNSNGDCQWIRLYNGTGDGHDDPSAMVLDNTGNIYVTGSSFGSDGDDDIVTVKYSPDGDTVWVRRYVDYYARASALAVDGKGNIIVAGTCGASEIIVIQYSPAGETCWEQKYIEPDNSTYSVQSLELDDNGDAYITGMNYKSAGVYSLTIKYSNSGNLEWNTLTSFGEGSSFHPIGIRVDASGHVYIAGTSTIGSEAFYTVIKYMQTPNSVDRHAETSPITFSLQQNYPNPFNPSTTIRYALPSSAQVKLTIHDILGREIATLVNEEQSAGWKEVQWNAKDVSSGIYFCKLQTESFVNVKKALVVK